jgi:hypothetical protein
MDPFHPQDKEVKKTYYEGGWAPYTELRNGQYPEAVLSAIVRDLSQINPHIELDVQSRALVEKCKLEGISHKID